MGDSLCKPSPSRRLQAALVPAAAMGRGMGSIAFACLQLIPIIIYVCYAYTLLFVGAYALAEDYAVSDHACGKTYHLWKFCCVNSLLCFFTCLSYCVWRGGGEGARARAMVLTMLYFGFFMWGLLLWQRMSPACANIFNKQFHTLYVFHHICTCTNGLFFFLFCLHESFLGKKLGGDYTIMAEVQHRYNTPYRPPMDISPPHGHSSPSTLQTMQTPPPPAGLPPQLSYEYEKIMQSTSSSSLPQTTP